MRKLSEMFTPERIQYGMEFVNDVPYRPHLLGIGEGTMSRITVSAWSRRGWVYEVRDERKGQHLSGRIYLTDEGLELVEAFRAASDSEPVASDSQPDREDA